MKKKKRKNNKFFRMIVIIGLIIGGIALYNYSKKPAKNPEDTLKTYMSYINSKEYDKMYELISKESKEKNEKDTYLARNKNIYEGIGLKDLKINIVKTSDNNNKKEIIYHVSMETVAGEISFSNTSYFNFEDEEYKLIWSSKDIFPELKDNYKVRVETIDAERGKILDRNGNILAGRQTASEVGLVPGKLNSDTKDSDINTIANLLEISKESIEEGLSASYVGDDTFVPLKTIRKSEQTLKNQLLEISGVMIYDTEERIYPLAAATSHLLGYIQSISKEELETKKDENYTEYSVIGKTGLEKIFEDRLRAKDGAKIYIENDNGKEVKTLSNLEAKNGEDIKLTIDSDLQQQLYEQFKDDKSAHVAMNPKTGEILALVSTPTFDSNDFSLGMTESKWEKLTNDDRNPLYNRYLSSYAPGSSIKPIVGAIGLDTESFTADEDFGESVTKWQKNDSWGDFYISTLTTYGDESTLQDALIYSDNIYFAKAALKIGSKNFVKSLDDIGFGKQIDFTEELTKSTYSNSDNISDERQLANSGYGQAEMLVNPVHMAMIYSSFINRGNMIKPYLEYKEDVTNPEYYKRQAFNVHAANDIKDALIQVVENENGTAHNLQIDGLTLAAKTGTAEIKASQDDEEGTEIGWLDSFIADQESEKQLLIISMVEDVKGRGGSHYLLDKIRTIYEEY